MDPETAQFAGSYQRFIEAMTAMASSDAISPLRTLLDEHLGVDSTMIPVISDSVPAYDHVNVQVALTRFLELDGRGHRLLGLTGHQRHYASFSDLLETAHMMGVRVGAPDLVTLATRLDDVARLRAVRALLDRRPRSARRDLDARRERAS